MSIVIRWLLSRRRKKNNLSPLEQFNKWNSSRKKPSEIYIKRNSKHHHNVLLQFFFLFILYNVCTARSSLFFKRGENKRLLTQKVISFTPQGKYSISISLLVCVCWFLPLLALHTSVVFFFSILSSVVVAAAHAGGPTHLLRRIQINKSLKTVRCIRMFYIIAKYRICAMVYI